MTRESLVFVVCTSCGRARAFTHIKDITERLGHVPELEDHFQFTETCFKCAAPTAPLDLQTVTQWRQRNHA